MDYGHEIEKWINFLIELQTQMLDLTGNVSEELAVEAMTDTQKLTRAIDDIRSDPKNWIVSEIKKENNEVTRVQLKPLDVSHYCKGVFEKCNKILMMSATILDKDAFCKSLGLTPEEVKFIPVASDFPSQNRPIIPLNIARLDFNTLQQQQVKTILSGAVENVMTLHRNHKGIVHTTSYKQIDFIKENISQVNKSRLLETNPERQRDEVIAEHIKSIEPTVLISPSLYTGLDLKDDLSRFQIVIKVPYPDLGDRWINEKKKRSGQWYNWQTALRLVQAYGRSVRSKEDYAVTYVLDSGFENFVKKNKNILPDWFTQAIQSDLLKAPLEHAAFDGDSSKVSTPSKENHNNPVTNNHYNSSIISEQQNVKQKNVNNTTEKNVASAIPIKPSWPSETFANLDSYNKDESNRPERLSVCPYCPKFSTLVEREYQYHIVMKHPGKPGYPNMAVVG
ncbi:MAG: helicase C-terminal domain-containing protein [Candidatus Nitrosopolaris sp.]